MDEENPRTIRNTLRHIGYAAAFVSGSAAAVYTLSSALRRHDLSAIWMMDKRAAPPEAIQRELQGGPYGSETDEDSDNEARREKVQRELAAKQGLYHAQCHRLEAKMNRAVRTGNMQRVKELASRIKDLQDEHEAGPRAQEHRARLNLRETHSDRASHKQGRSSAGQIYDQDPRQRLRAAEMQQQGMHREWDSREVDSDEEHGGGACGGVQRRVACSTPEDRRRARDQPPCDHEKRCSGPARSSGDEEQRVCVHRQDSNSRYGVQPAGPDTQTGAPRISVRRAQRKDIPCDNPTPPEECVVASENTLHPTEQLPRAPSRKRIAETPVSASALEAESKLRAGDLVKAECPFSHEWHDATVRAIRGRGLVEVRWHNPGTDEHGRPFSRYGDVWADKVHFIFRKDAAQPTQSAGALNVSEQLERLTQGAAQADEVAMAGNALAIPDGLQVGDECFARGSMLELKWFKARVVAVRPKTPCIRVEYLATFDGDTMPLLLPEPRKAFVHEEDVRREKPAHALASAAAPNSSAPDAAAAPPASNGEQASSKGDRVEDAIDEDLMCSVCARPDDEANMLVCDCCKKGFHIYCLSPKLSHIPEGDWQCPECSAAAHP
jgi:hypothetical protein